MNTILYIQTALHPYWVGVGKGDAMLAERQTTHFEDAQQFIHSSIQEIFHAQHITMADIDAICVNVGPGSYTSLRIGIAAAVGIGLFTQKKMIALSTLHTMAIQALRHRQPQGEKLLCVVHARKNEYYVAWFDCTRPVYEQDIEVFVADTHFLSLQTSTTLVALEGERESLVSVEHPHLIFLALETTTLAEAGNLYHQAKQFVDLHRIEPLYVRNPYM